MEKVYLEDWITAYQEKVREKINYQGFTIKSSSEKIFEKLLTMYPDVNPYTYMSAIFDPNIWWGTKDKKGEWKKFKYPFPTMLVGKKAENIYNKYVKNHKKEMSSKSDEILDGVKTSLDKLKTLKVNISDKEEIYNLTIDGTISPYLTMSLKSFYTWWVLQNNKGVIDNMWLEELTETHKYLNNHPELKSKIEVISGEYV